VGHPAIIWKPSFNFVDLFPKIGFKSLVLSAFKGWFIYMENHLNFG